MRRRPLLFALLLLAGPPAVADILLVGGRPVRCTWWEDGDTVVVNPYNSTNHAMTWGVERYAKSKVNLAKVKSTETPEEEFCRRSFDARAGTAEDHAALAKWCEEKKLPELAARAWERVLEVDPANEAAKKALGPSTMKDVLRRNGKANAALGELLQQYVAAANPATRRILLDRMKKEHDVGFPAFYLERAWRSGARPKGRTDDVPLTFRSEKVKGEEGAKYTIFVPASYDPLRATPLLLGLHGGGTGGKKNDKVVGSGPSAMNFYTGICEARGWICVCPTAIQAPWNQDVNGDFLEAVLQEVALLYNVDLNRVYLTGHSMGGFGTWFWGPKWAERWAAIAPMAGGGGPGLPRLKDTLTPVFILHGADDNVVRVDDDRAAARSLLDSGHDFVYVELNGIGHGCPQEVLDEMAAYFEKKRLAIGHGKAFRRSDEIRSSFLEKPGREEKHYLGNPDPPDPAAAAEKPEAKRTRLLADIDLGGGKAEAAAEAYADWKDAESVKLLAARLASAGKVADDVRAAAAKALGNIGSAEGLPTLERAVLDANDGVFHAALGAVLAIGDRKSGPALLKALEFQSKQFEGKLMGTSMDFSDFDPRSNALGAAAGAVAALADPRDAVARIRDRAVKTFFEGTYRVQALARAGEFPEEIRNRTGRQIAEALAKTASPAAKDVLQHLKSVCAKEASIADACDAALASLDGTAAAAPPPPPSGGG